MDFIEKLLSFSRFDTILVIVDWLAKQAIFIPAHDTIMSVDLAHLFILHVFSKHSVPFHVISNRSSEFVSNFFRSLGTALDMWLHFTSGYHPESNRQTEHMNQTLEQYLCVYCNYQQDNWSKLLPLMEFAYNNAPSITTSVSPFFTNKGYHPNITVHPKHNIASFRACDFAIDLDDLQSTLKAEISAAQQCYQKSADAQYSPTSDFKVGNKVFVKARSSEPPSLQRNSPKDILDPMKSSLSLALYHSLSVFQSPCTLFIQSSMCSCLNPPRPTLSPREYSQPPLQS